MIKTTRDVYLTEFQDMTFRQRHYYILHNELCIDWKQFAISKNPLRWCLLDLFNILYLPLLLLVLYPLLVYPISLFSARDLKTRYKDEEDKTWFKSDCKIIE